MDENEVEGGGDGYSGDPNEQFHRNEAISAVADDDGFLGEEDDDYEDLYNDVNVGENFQQSLRSNEDHPAHRTEEVQDKKLIVDPPPPPPPQMQQQPLLQPQPQPQIDGEGMGLSDEGAPSRIPGIVAGFQDVGVRGDASASDVGRGRGAGGLVPGGGVGFRVELGQSSNKIADLEERAVNSNVPNNQQMVHHQQPHVANLGTYDNARSMGNMNGSGGNVYGADGMGGGPGIGGDGAVGGGIGVGSGGGGTVLFVGDLHWWTTDSELEAELCKYGPVKEVKFFDERASGKSKGYCQVEFFDPGAATSCKEGMSGHVFNGRPCVVAYASPYTVKRMGEAQVNRNQQQMGGTAVNQPRRGPADLPSKPGGVGNNIHAGGNPHNGGDNNGRGFGRGNWGRGNAQGGMNNRGPVGPMRSRAGGMAGRGLAGNGFGQLGGAPPMMHPQAMMGKGFDPAFAGHMGRMGGYGGFPGAPAAPFPSILSSFGPVGNVGLPGVAPHVNPAFFGRGMPLGGMGMGPTPGVEGPNMGMWSDPNMGGWAGDEHGGRAGESSYGEEATSDHQYGEGSQERGPWPNTMKDKDRGSERDWSGSSERRYRDDRGAGYERDASREKDVRQDHDWSERRHRDDKDVVRDRQKEREKDRERSIDHERGGRERERERHRDDRDRYGDHHRHKNREVEYDDDWDRGRSSRSHGKSRVSHEEEHRSRSRDADYGKRRRLTSD
ncbi:cleavage and polyadenylation specificity factor subunit 6-like [Salvia splendens]|uniref:cleavage and polyadenylation specificity factor subunit 6-like n=1 Tax=Salvia splendens TaxID=180675 RepID=UPI001C27701C|nr:cleavage and polyadenylation specificity factor subunit 6-like [Salvia splendens]XP_042003126.1 cleavage and polyadenylation specificity factor subunit 6-like [Salvia splendens]XP_042003127.1 cleavage and polyadenylation specificity factor subunit 6-like [Salvia splendens]XP_042003129.1 cleavage and polyadenylation specificity factor subunit 6-like [Salvia splendens]XP_042003130.1 cleavage and polyadenylation specificity factor subunit 6-like [Salvia splendens]